MFLLDQFTLAQLREWRRNTREVLDYHWDYYSCLAQQREGVYHELKSSLVSAAAAFRFESWQRVVDYRYSNDPLASTGSVMARPGGRFNIGRLHAIKFPKFPALYLASDFITGLRERFAIDEDVQQDGVPALDLVLAGSRNLAAVRIEGALSMVLDLRTDVTLEGFVSHIRNFEIPRRLHLRARSLGLPAPGVVRSTELLRANMLEPEWRAVPIAVDVPSNSQILGQLAHAAGIEGILYPSARGGALCLAVFPENVRPGSYVQLDGGEGARPPTVEHWRLSHSTRDDFR